jgi:hypothetical protein
METRVFGKLSQDGLEVVEREGRYFLRYDAGSHQVSWREDEITSDEFALLKDGVSGGYGVIIGLQRRLQLAGVDPFIQNWSPVVEMFASQNNPAITVSSVRDAGTCVIYSFTFVPGLEVDGLEAILNGLSPESEVSLIDPGDGDGCLEVRRTSTGFEIKRGRHGSYGTWRKATFQEAVSWLLAGVTPYREASRLGFQGTITVYGSHQE